MNSVVIYGSRYGNTRRIAEAIAAELRKHGSVLLGAAEAAPTFVAGQTDLLVIGGPTEAHRMTQPVAELLDRIADAALEGKAAAAFDTRVRWPQLLSGSAAAAIAKRLEQAGADLVVPPVSFFVGGKTPALEPGELEEACIWATSLAAKVESRASVVTAG